jgi:hypothetical protein
MVASARSPVPPESKVALAPIINDSTPYEDLTLAIIEALWREMPPDVMQPQAYCDLRHHAR